MPVNPNKVHAAVKPYMNAFFQNGTYSYVYAWMEFRLSLGDNRDAYEKNGRVWWRVSSAALAHETGFKQDTIRRSIDKLVELGVLDSEYHYSGGTNLSDRTRSFSLPLDGSPLTDPAYEPCVEFAKSTSGKSAKCIPLIEEVKRNDQIKGQEGKKPPPSVPASFPEPVETVRFAGGGAAAAEFDEQFWPKYPRKVDKKKARVKFLAARKTTPLDDILKGLDAYCEYTKNTEKQYIKHPDAWLHNERWTDEHELSGESAELSKAIAECDVNAIANLTGVVCRVPNFDGSPAEVSRLKREFKEKWVVENRGRLVLKPQA